MTATNHKPTKHRKRAARERAELANALHAAMKSRHIDAFRCVELSTGHEALFSTLDKAVEAVRLWTGKGDTLLVRQEISEVILRASYRPINNHAFGFAWIPVFLETST